MAMYWLIYHGMTLARQLLSLAILTANDEKLVDVVCKSDKCHYT